MRKLFKFTFIIFLFIVTSCVKVIGYEISINNEAVTEFYVGEDEIDYKSMFIIKDQDGNYIEVLDSMIDASSVDLNKSGTYKVKLTYKSSVKEVEITIIEGSTSTYFITINNELSTTLDVGTTDVDFKQFFFIKDSNGNSVEVLDSMIDLSNVNLGEAGTFTITIKYQDLVKDLLFNVVAKDNDIVYEDFDLIFGMMKDLELDNKGTATSEHKIKVKGTVYMDVISETSLVYLTDGKNFVKLHGEKIHNYTAPNSVYEIECYYKSHIYQPTFEVINPSNDIKRLAGELIVGEIEVKEVTLSEILALKRENFALNISNGYLQSMLKIKGYLQLDTHNSSKYDYCLTIGETYTKNNTGYINNGLYFKNDVEELDDFLIDYEVVKNGENVQVDVFGVIYEWNTNRKNWRIYVSSDLTKDNLINLN